MRALIVDDEPLARSRLKRLLITMQHFEHLDEAENAQQAILLNQQYLPEVVFMDINLPGKNGLLLAKQFTEQATPPAIIFVTAHAEHALAAYDCAPKDYLLKPISQESLSKALAKLNLTTRADHVNPQPPLPQLSYLRAGIKHSLELAAVCYFRAEAKYVTAVLIEKEIVLEDTLSALQQRFPEHLVRIHRSTLVNKAYCQAVLNRQGKHYLQCKGRAELLEISRRMLSQVRLALTMPSSA